MALHPGFELRLTTSLPSSLQRTRPQIAGLVCLALALPSLSGCMLDGLTPVGVPQTPDAFLGAKPISAWPVSTDWPRAFGSPELSHLADAVVQGNFDIAAAVARIEQADAQALQAASQLYPQLDGTSNAQRTQVPGTTRTTTGPFKTTASNMFSLGISASYALDFFGKNRATAEAGDLNTAATAFDRDTVVLTSLSSLANSYFSVLAAQDRLRILRENIKSASEILEAIKARLDAGTGTALDTAQQETLLANQRAQVPGLDQTLQQTRNNLALLAGRTPETSRIAGGSLRSLTIPRVRPGLPSELLLRRPDIAAAEARLNAQNASVKAARAAFFPSINLTGGLTLESLTLANLLRPEALATSLALGLTQPIFNGRNLEGLEKQAEGRYRELLGDYAKTIVQALTDVENALIAVRQTSEQVRLLGISVQSARRAYDITNARLREGTIDVVTLLNTEQSLFNAQDALVQAQLARAQASVTLFQALGGGFSLPRVLTGDAIMASEPAVQPAEDGQ